MTSASSSTPTSSSAFLAKPKQSIRNTIDFAKSLDCETIQVSIAHAYPGTEFYEFAEKNGFITNQKMEDDMPATRWHTSNTPDSLSSTSWRWFTSFYDEYYFRPKAAFRVVWKAIVNRDVPRLYVEAKSFMKLRSLSATRPARKMKEENALKQQESVSMNA